MPVKNKEGLYLPFPQIEGKYVKNAGKIIKMMKTNHPSLGDISLGSHVKIANDLKHGEKFIEKWYYSGNASAVVFIPFYESFIKDYGYQSTGEDEIVPEPETFVITDVKRLCRINASVVFNGDKKGNIPKSFAKEGGYIRCDHLRLKGDTYYYCA